MMFNDFRVVVVVVGISAGDDVDDILMRLGEFAPSSSASALRFTASCGLVCCVFGSDCRAKLDT